MLPTLLEAAVETCSDAVLAVAAGAGSLELCASVSIGGVTPKAELARAVRAAVSLPLHVLVLPRPSGFVLDDQGEAEIARDVARLGAVGASGVVIGALTADGCVDELRMRPLARVLQALEG